MHRHRSSVNFRGARHFCSKNMYETLTKCPNFTLFLPEKLAKYPNFYICLWGSCHYVITREGGWPKDWGWPLTARQLWHCANHLVPVTVQDMVTELGSCWMLKHTARLQNKLISSPPVTSTHSHTNIPPVLELGGGRVGGGLNPTPCSYHFTVNEWFASYYHTSTVNHHALHPMCTVIRASFGYKDKF